MKFLTIPAYDTLPEATRAILETALIWIDESYNNLWQLESESRITFEDAVYKYVFSFQYLLDERVIGAIAIQDQMKKEIKTPLGFIIKGGECQLCVVELPPYLK